VPDIDYSGSISNVLADPPPTSASNMNLQKTKNILLGEFKAIVSEDKLSVAAYATDSSEGVEVHVAYENKTRHIKTETLVTAHHLIIWSKMSKAIYSLAHSPFCSLQCGET
jgi:hypothetical protein